MEKMILHATLNYNSFLRNVNIGLMSVNKCLNKQKYMLVIYNLVQTTLKHLFGLKNLHLLILLVKRSEFLHLSRSRIKSSNLFCEF